MVITSNRLEDLLKLADLQQLSLVLEAEEDMLQELDAFLRQLNGLAGSAVDN